MQPCQKLLIDLSEIGLKEVQVVTYISGDKFYSIESKKFTQIAMEDQ